MQMERQLGQTTITNAHDWDPDGVADLRRRLDALQQRFVRPGTRMRAVLAHEDHPDPDKSFGVSVHLDMGLRTLHAHADGPTEFHAAAEIEDRLHALLEHERERRWWARHHRGVRRPFS
jgi:ribosome-associated translation inhibitor RaiA